MVEISGAAVFCWLPAASDGLMFYESACKPVDRILTELFFLYGTDFGCGGGLVAPDGLWRLHVPGIWLQTC